jgi:hypothetical protein
MGLQKTAVAMLHESKGITFYGTYCRTDLHKWQCLLCFLSALQVPSTVWYLERVNWTHNHMRPSEMLRCSKRRGKHQRKQMSFYKTRKKTSWPTERNIVKYTRVSLFEIKSCNMSHRNALARGLYSTSPILSVGLVYVPKCISRKKHQ